MSNKPEVRHIALLFPVLISKLGDAETDWPSGFQSFFGPKTIPDDMCSRSYTNRHGKVLKIATVADVVNWAQTVRGGRQGEMHFDDIEKLRELAESLVADLDISTFTADYDKLPGELPHNEDGRSCPSNMGLCE